MVAFLLLVGSGLFIIAWQTLAQSFSESKKILSAKFTVEAGEQKFKTFYIPEPSKGFQVTYNVSEGNIKWNFLPATIFEESLGYYESYDEKGNVTGRFQHWLYDANHGTLPVGTTAGHIFYLLFYNEDTFQKEVTIQISTI